LKNYSRAVLNHARSHTQKKLLGLPSKAFVVPPSTQKPSQNTKTELLLSVKDSGTRFFVCLTQNLKAAAMVMATAIAPFWPNKANPAIDLI
jgi:hypothetical protein